MEKDYYAILDAQLQLLYQEQLNDVVRTKDSSYESEQNELFMKKHGVTMIEVVGMLYKLVEDGYIKYPTVKDPIKHMITFKGLIFIQEGGYVGMREKEQAAEKRITNIERNQRSLAKRTFYLAVVVFLFQLIPVLNNGLQVYKFYYSYNHPESSAKQHNQSNKELSTTTRK